jgi:hypothetical protein
VKFEFHFREGEFDYTVTLPTGQQKRDMLRPYDAMAENARQRTH